MFEKVTKSDVVAVVGLGLAAAVVSEFVPSARPLLRSAIQFGVDLLAESEAEAEAELIQSLVKATLRGIRQDLSESANEPDCCSAVQSRIEAFKQQARKRAERWGNEPRDRDGRYRRHIARFEARLAEEKQQLRARDQRILDYAFEALAAEA